MRCEGKLSRIVGLLGLISALAGCAAAASEDHADAALGAYGLQARPSNTTCLAWKKDAPAPASLSATGETATVIGRVARGTRGVVIEE